MGDRILDGYKSELEEVRDRTYATPCRAASNRPSRGKALKERGFKFVGPTICYAFMQAVGMVNDHAADCFRYRALK